MNIWNERAKVRWKLSNRTKRESPLSESLTHPTKKKKNQQNQKNLYKVVHIFLMKNNILNLSFWPPLPGWLVAGSSPCLKNMNSFNWIIENTQSKAPKAHQRVNNLDTTQNKKSPSHLPSLSSLNIHATALGRAAINSLFPISQKNPSVHLLCYIYLCNKKGKTPEF